jgi:hypothetical protein
MTCPVAPETSANLPVEVLEISWPFLIFSKTAPLKGKEKKSKERKLPRERENRPHPLRSDVAICRDQEAKMTGAETKRDRVRRLLIQPLTAKGFRKPGNVRADDHRAALDKLADDLAYMSDHSLQVLHDMLKSKGQGRDHDVWPARATALYLAEHIQPRPVEELPGLLRWFKSVEGPKAARDGTLVETWAYFRKYKRPPLRAHRQLLAEAQDNHRKLELYQDRIRRNVAQPEEVQFVERYQQRLAYCQKIVEEGQAA